MAKSVLSDEVDVTQSQLNKLQQSDRYYTRPKTTEGRDFFIFVEYGDFIKGKLYGRHSNHHINRTCSYPIQVEAARRNGIDLDIETDQIDEFFANRRLRSIIEKNELVGSIVKIVFVGRLKSNFGGHAEKVYRVFKETGILTSQEEIQNDTGKRKRSKSRRQPHRAAATT